MEGWLSKQNTNALRAFASIGIMFVHIGSTIDDPDNIFLCFSSIGYLCVGVFFFYTGYNLMYTCRNKGFEGFVGGKAARIYIPFVIANILYIIFLQVNGDYVFEWKSGIQYIVGTKLVNITLWYVIHTLFYEALFWMVFQLLFHSPLKKRDGCTMDKKFYGLGMVSTFLLFTFVYPYFANFTGSLKNENECVPICILAGGFIQLWGENLIHWLRKYKIELFFLLFFVLCVCHGNNVKGMEWNVMGFNLYDFLSPLLTALAFNLLLLDEKLVHPFIQHIGTVSYEVYLLHAMFMFGLRSNLIFISNDYVYVFVYVLCLLSAAAAFHWFNGKLRKMLRW